MDSIDQEPRRGRRLARKPEEPASPKKFYTEGQAGLMDKPRGGPQGDSLDERGPRDSVVTPFTVGKAREAMAVARVGLRSWPRGARAIGLWSGQNSSGWRLRSTACSTSTSRSRPPSRKALASPLA